MNKENFIDIIYEAVNYDNLLQEYSNFIQFDHPIFEFGWDMFNKLMQSHFTKEGIEWVEWWLWECNTSSGERLPWYDEKGEKHYVNTAEELWEIVKDYQL